MNCQQYKELIVDYIEDLLDTPQKEAFQKHLNDCPGCRSELEQTKALQNRLDANGRLAAQSDLETAVMNRIFREQAFQLRKTNQQKQSLNIWRLIMKNRTLQLASAAAIVIAALAAVYFITGKTPSVTCCAWAKIADKVEQIKTCICRAKAKVVSPQGDQESEMQMFLSSDHGLRMDTFAAGSATSSMSMYMRPDDKTMVSVIPSAKKYMRVVLTDEQVVEMKKRQDPRDMISGYMTAGEFIELGTQTINGIQAKGVKVVNPPGMQGVYSNFTCAMWVDVATELPVQLEIEGEISTGDTKMTISMVMNDFEWGAELTPDIFEPNIPPDYTMLAEVKMPGQDEPSAVEGLRLFAEITDGNYPSQMNLMTVMTEAQKALMKNTGADPNVNPTEEQMQLMMAKMMKLQAAVMFYTKLAQDGNEPAYYGKDVKAGDADSVLMSWKISDNQYRVIFGDLSDENVSADRLKEMEQPANR